MVKAKTLYIWEGPDAITLTRGTGLQKSADVPFMYNAKVKHKGIFQPLISVLNIDEMYIGISKKLIVKDTPAAGWEVVRIRKDFLTHDPYLPDVSPAMVAQVKSLRNEVEIWRKKYFDAKKLNEDREQKDRFRGRVMEDFDWVSKAKNKFYPTNDAFGGGFASRWGLTPPISQSPSGEE